MTNSDSKKRVAFLPPPPLDEGDPIDEINEREEDGERSIRTCNVAGNSTWSIVKKTFAEKKPVAENWRLVTKDKVPNIEGYEFIRMLGRGGMGNVYLARDENLDRQVAIKTLSRTASHLRDRFDAETKAVAALQHPNIVQLFAADKIYEQPYFVMEFVDGQSLEEQLESKPQDPHRSAKLIREIADAIAYTHDRGLLHRDLKPSNILMTQDGVPKVADFGLAKSYHADSSSTQTGEIIGTPSYMAPEQAVGVVKKLNETCDVYGLGGLLYKMLTGRPPFESPDPMQTVLAVISDDPITPRKLQPQIPRDLENICLKCLAKNPGRRYENAKELSADLNRFLNNEPVKARSISVAERVTKWTRRHPAAALGIAAAVLLVGMTIGGLAFHNQQLENEISRSNRLIENSNKFSFWITEEHLVNLQHLQGSTPHRKALAEHLQIYLDEMYADAKAEPEFIFQLSMSYAGLADVLGNPNNPNMGMLDQAVANYERAIELAKQSLKMRPKHGNTERGLATFMIRLQDVIYVRDGFEKAEPLLDSAEEYAEGIEYPDDGYRASMQVMLKQRRYDIALERQEHEKCLHLLDQLEPFIEQLKGHKELDSDHIQHLVHLKTTRGELLRRLEKFEESQKEFLAAYEISQEDYQNNPADFWSADRHIKTIIGYGDILFHVGQFEKSLELFEEATALRRQLQAIDPSNSNNRKSLAVNLSRVGDAHSLLQDFDRAIETKEESVSIIRDLIKTTDNNLELRRNLTIELSSLASSYSMAQRLEESAKIHREAVELVQKLLEEYPDNLTDLNKLGECYLQYSLCEFLRYMQALEVENRSFSRDDPGFKKVITLSNKSLECFEKLETLGELNALQQNMFETVEAQQQMVEDWAKQMEQLQQQQNSEETNDQKEDL